MSVEGGAEYMRYDERLASSWGMPRNLSHQSSYNVQPTANRYLTPASWQARLLCSNTGKAKTVSSLCIQRFLHSLIAQLHLRTKPPSTTIVRIA